MYFFQAIQKEMLKLNPTEGGEKDKEKWKIW